MRKQIMETRCFYAVITHNNAIQKRRMTVIDGQPFYESSGSYSGFPGCWLPFIMLKGSILPYQYPSQLNTGSLNKIFRHANYNENYFIKYEHNVVAPTDQDEKFTHVINGRIPNKKTLIISLQLTMQNNIFQKMLLNYQHLLTQDEVKFILENPIKLQQNHCPEVHTPDAINQTLIQMGASDLELMLTEQLTQPLDEPPSYLSHPASIWKQPLQKALTTGHILAYSKFAL